MALTVQMPALGESVTEGTVTRWLKHEGDTVEVDEPLLEVSTDKVDTEIPSPTAGVLTKIIAKEDDIVEVGGDLGTIGDDGAGDDDSPPEVQDESEPATTSTPAGREATSVVMPELGESVIEGTVTRWLKKVGDTVAVDEALLEVSTDKVDTEIPSPVAGTVISIIAREDDVVAVGGELATIGDADGKPSSPEPEPTSDSTAREPEIDQRPKSTIQPRGNAPAEPPSDAAPYVTPLVRKLATENGVDLSSVKSTGVGGRIRKQDVLAAATTEKASAPAAPAREASVDTAQAPVPSPPPNHVRGTTQKTNRIRQITAQKTRESLQTTAQLTQVHEVDMTKIVALRKRAKEHFAEREGVNLTYLPFFAVAVIDALKAHPNVNASYDEDKKEITYYDYEHLGFAVDTPKGLLSPVVHNAGDLSLAGLARAIADVAARARAGALTPDELSGGTFTITNIGSQGALFDTPILIPPQAAMLGTGAIVKRPRVVIDDSGNESIGVRSVAYLPMTYDHRLVDGADAGRFLTTIKRRLEEAMFEPELWL